MSEPTTLDLAPITLQPLATPVAPSPADILRAVVEKGITPENMAVVERLAGMCREVRAEESKTAFFRAHFRLRKTMPAIYADREVRTKSGELAFQYCSPQEIKDALEPHLLQHGFSTIVGQALENNQVTVTLTVIHELGHSESRSYTTRVSPGTSLMSPTQCDAAATTAAERQLLIRFFGLRTRLRADDDPRHVGEFISAALAEELHRRVQDLHDRVDEVRFLRFAGVQVDGLPARTHYQQIMSGKYEVLDAQLRKKEQQGK